ncbi:MAG: hypothetical protein V1686_00010 [Patescibacteria group bacterium]
MNTNYTNYYRRPYEPKKAVKSFQDLEIYQKALESSVAISNTLSKNSGKKIKNSGASKEIKTKIINEAIDCANQIPHLMAAAHSCRFGSETQCLRLLDEVMMKCNRIVVYLEQVRDICQIGAEWEWFNERVKTYFYIRRKTLNLQRVWRKYIQINKQETLNGKN